MKKNILPFVFFILFGCADDQPTKIVDGDGNIYTSVVIGTQTWLKENLKTTKYNDGTSIPHVSDNATWNTLDSPAYSWYDNSDTNKDKYGALYNWYVINSEKICPKGWHVPSDEDWSKLITHLDPAASPTLHGTESSSAGGAMKSTGDLASNTGLWLSPNTGASNSSGFTAHPGGLRYSDGSFFSISSSAYWWSSTQFDAESALDRTIDYNQANLYRGAHLKNFGMACRCVKD